MSDDDERRDEPQGRGEESATDEQAARPDAVRDAKEELFEAFDHFKSAASIFFNRAVSDPSVQSATREASRIAKKISDAAEPLAKQLTSELGRLTKDVMNTVESAVESARKPTKRPPPRREPTDEEE